MINVQPPNTGSGKVANKAPKAGNKPANTIMIAPIKIVKRLTTFVIATSPTFWLKDVIGIQPNSAEILLIKPSQAIEPEISFSVASRFKPETAKAEVSPIVSVAETRKISITEIIAFKLNSGLKGKNSGSAIMPLVATALKSTFPKK